MFSATAGPRRPETGCVSSHEAKVELANSLISSQLLTFDPVGSQPARFTTLLSEFLMMKNRLSGGKNWSVSVTRLARFWIGPIFIRSTFGNRVAYFSNWRLIRQDS